AALARWAHRADGSHDRQSQGDAARRPHPAQFRYFRRRAQSRALRQTMNLQTKPPAIRHESLRIAGKRVDLDERVEVFNPYNGAVVGTVPAARPEHVRAAFAKGAAFKPKLSRYERQQVLLRTAELLRDRKEEFARLITAESGLCWKDSLYEA